MQPKIMSAVQFNKWSLKFNDSIELSLKFKKFIHGKKKRLRNLQLLSDRTTRF